MSTLTFAAIENLSHLDNNIPNPELSKMDNNTPEELPLPKCMYNTVQQGLFFSFFDDETF